MTKDINGYLLHEEFSVENAGMCQWGFAQKDGHEYFIKEFLSPKYPLDEKKLGLELTKKMQESANAFYERKSQFYSTLAECRTGNNVVVLDFFRYGAKYYAVTDKVSGNLLSVADVSKLSDEKKYVLIRSILYSLSKVHSCGIVHSDLKPENILVKVTSDGYCTAKIIDFDSGFLESDVPERIEGSQNYFSPEALRRINGGDCLVSTKSDVWALGLLIHQYWCGSMPHFPSNYRYVSEAVANNCILEFDDSIPVDVKSIIQTMLDKDPDIRPSVEKAWSLFCELSASTSINRDEPVRADPVTSGWFVPDDLN